MSTDRFTEIINLMSAMSREIGAFRTEVNSRFDRLEARVGNLEGRVGSLETEMRAGFEKVHTDIRLLNHKFDEFAIDVMDLRARQRDLGKRTEVLERKAGITDPV